jgi:hypothetical protein
MFVEGEFIDTVIGISDSRTEIVMLRPPDGGTRLELSSFVRPDHQPGSPAAMVNEPLLRNVAFEVDDLQAAVDRLAPDGYGLVGGIGQYEHIWRMAYVRGPEGNHCLPGRAHRPTPPSMFRGVITDGDAPGHGGPPIPHHLQHDPTAPGPRRPNTLRGIHRL